MGRINVDTTPDGWFDPDTSTVYDEDLRWIDETDEDDLDSSAEDEEGGYYVSAATGTDYSHEQLYHTADGRWVLKQWTNQKRAGTYSFISEAGAATWLDINTPPKPAPRRGRPEVGEAIHLRLPRELKAQLDQFASTNNITRAEAVRQLLAKDLADRAGN